MSIDTQSLREAGATAQALFVSLGGLIGVFSTLAVFYLIIRACEAFGRRSPTDD
jgi:hypothetical protein